MYGTQIKIGTYAELKTAADGLRQKVFVEEQGVPEDEVFDGLNEQAIHVVIFEGEVPAATARLYQNKENWQIGLVAVELTKRGQQYGKKVMRAAMDYVFAHHGAEIILTAQQQAKGFYEKLGFCQCGENKVFESGFVLVPMKLTLKS